MIISIFLSLILISPINVTLQLVIRYFHREIQRLTQTQIYKLAFYSLSIHHYPLKNALCLLFFTSLNGTQTLQLLWTPLFYLTSSPFHESSCPYPQNIFRFGLHLRTQTVTFKNINIILLLFCSEPYEVFSSLSE